MTPVGTERMKVEPPPLPQPLVVEFPLRGEWVAQNTPARRVPSHGTDMLGQRYAFDFVRIDPTRKGASFCKAGTLQYLFLGSSLRDCYGWGQPIHSPVYGIVIRAEDGWPERERVHPVRDLALALKNGLTFDPKRLTDFRRLGGNYLVIEGTGGYALLAHAQTGSLAVKRGESVETGQFLAQVGHSGNSTAPHLHFQMMDRADPREANGILCCFREYEVLRNGAWMRVENGIPQHTEVIRSVP